MNELYLNGWLYFKTSETDIDKAIDRLTEILTREGIGFDFDIGQLRNEDDEVIG